MAENVEETENIGMKDMGGTRAEEASGVGETNLDDELLNQPFEEVNNANKHDDLNESIPIFNPETPNFPSVPGVKPERSKEFRKMQGKIGGDQSRAKTKFVKENFDYIIKKNKNTERLYKNLVIDTDDNGVETATYNNKEIFVKRGSRWVTKTNIFQDDVTEFQTLMTKNGVRFGDTVEAIVEGVTGVYNPPLTKSVVKDTLERIDELREDEVLKTDKQHARVRSSIEEEVEEGALYVTPQELRETRAVLEGSIFKQEGQTMEEQLDLLKKEQTAWLKKSAEEPNVQKKNYYKSVARVAGLDADKLNLRLNLRPKMVEIMKIMEGVAEDHVITRFLRFKQWAKENMGVLTVGSITVASLITSIVLGLKRAVVKGGSALGKFGKAVFNTMKKWVQYLLQLVNYFQL